MRDDSDPTGFDGGFDSRYGLELISEDVEGDKLVRAQIPVRQPLLNSRGVVHGGVFASAAESLALRGTNQIASQLQGSIMTRSNETNVVYAPSEGMIEVDARIVSDEVDSWLWAVDARDGLGRLCAHSTIVVALFAGP